jgi:hypothetical protein
MHSTRGLPTHVEWSLSIFVFFKDLPNSIDGFLKRDLKNGIQGQMSIYSAELCKHPLLRIPNLPMLRDQEFYHHNHHLTAQIISLILSEKSACLMFKLFAIFPGLPSS